MIYIMSSINWNIYEIAHICMHIPDIVQFEFSYHSHHKSDDLTAQHSHSFLFDQLEFENSTQQVSDIETGHENPVFENPVNIYSPPALDFLSQGPNLYLERYSYQFLKFLLAPPKEV